jgi:hypothetical protein
MNQIILKVYESLIRFGVIILFFFSLITTTQAQVVKIAENKNDASVIATSIPAEMYTGHSYTLFIRIRNTGTSIWTPGFYKYCLLDSSGNEIKGRWSTTELNIRSEVKSGSDLTFSFTEKAPSIPGNYAFQWRMKSDNSFFGEATEPIEIRVKGSPLNEEPEMKQLSTRNSEGDDASFLMQIMTNEMTPNMPYDVAITMQNTGKTTWSKDGNYSLSFADSLLNIENNNLKYTKVDLTEDVKPGAEVTFNFVVRAPNAPGEYEYQWSMLHGDTYFGQRSQKYTVSVR